MRSHQLCSVEMHSLAHFNMCVAFDGESEILLVLLTGKILYRLLKVQKELLSFME